MAETDAIIKSGLLWGGPRQGSLLPQAMAYTSTAQLTGSSGALSPTAYQFYTTIKPTTSSLAGAAWYQGTPGVISLPGDKAAIPIIAAKMSGR